MPNTVTGSTQASVAKQCSVPKAGEMVTGAGLSTMAQAIENDIATLQNGAITYAGVKTFADTVTFSDIVTCNGNVHLAQTKTLYADGTGCTIAGTWTASGAWTFNGAVTCTSTVSINSGGTLTCAAGSKSKTLGRSVPRSARVAIADGNKRIGVATGTSIDYAGKRFVVVNAPASPRTITLDHSNAAPDEGETIEVLCVALQGSTTEYTFQREDATVVATFTAPAGVSDNRNCWAEFEFVSGVWRLGANNGSSWDPSAMTPAAYGVLPGAGA